MRLLSREEFIQNGVLSASKKHYHHNGSTHSHDFFEIEYILDGSGVYTVNNTDFPMEAGMLFFLSPADTHRVCGKAELYNVMFPCSFFDSGVLFSLFAPESAAAIRLANTDAQEMELLFSELIDREPTYAQQFLKCILLKLSTLLPMRQSRTNSHIQAAIVYILEHFRQAITLRQTADALGLSAAYLSELFLSETGRNFKTYVDGLRFDHAAKLLRSTDLTVTEICFRAGFRDYANFSRRFRERFGCTAREYRQT